MQTIEDSAFYECSALTSLDFGINPQVTNIAFASFHGTSITDCSCGGSVCTADFQTNVLKYGEYGGDSSFSLGACISCAVGEDYSQQFGTCVKCPIKNACPTGYNCAASYEGDGCASCSGDFFYLNDACTQCPDTNIVVLMTLGVLFTAVLGVGIYYISGKMVNLAGLSTISIGHFQTISVFMKISFKIPRVFL